jgi:hypothetical protein
MWTYLLGAVVVSMFSGQRAPQSYHVAAIGDTRSVLLSAHAGAWKPATTVTWGPAPYETSFRALWSPHGLYLRFDAADDRPWHTMTRRDDHLWEEEVVEIFVDIDRSGRNYAELEISPGNVVCDVRIVEPWPNKQLDFGWNIEGLKTSVVRGPVAASATGPWTAVAFLPWAAFRTLPSARGVALPPRPGDRWRINLFRVKRPGGPTAPEQSAVEVAWSDPGQPSFHVPAAFRDFVFEGPTGTAHAVKR